MKIPLRLLLIEDSADDVDLILDALRQGSFDPTWKRVQTPQELRCALAETWDVVSSAYTLPGFGGPAALKIVREAELDLPFIVVSETVGEEAAVALMRAGANDYVHKRDIARLAPAIEREVKAAGNRRAKRIAEQRASLLAAVVESSDDAILSKSLDGVITSWNQAAERLYGWTAAEAIGRHISLHVPPDKADELAGNMRRLQAGEQVEYFETVRLHRDGRRLDVSMTISAVRGADGRPAGVSKTARDITSRKRAEEATRESEKRYRGLIESIPALVWVFDTTGRPVLHNSRWYEYTGKVPSAETDDWWHDLIHPADAVAAVAAWQRSKANGEPYEHEYRLRRADGTYRWFLSRKTPVRRPGGIEQWVGICADIDDRKRAETDLRRTADLLTAVAEGTTDAVYVKDREGKYLLFNESAARFVGKPVAEVLGKDDTALFDPAGAKRVMAQNRSVMESGRAEMSEEVLTAAGVTRTYQTTEAPLRDVGGEVVGVVGIARDITEQRSLGVERDQLLNRLKLHVERMPLAYILFDADVRITDWNPAAERIFGYTKVDALGRKWSDLVHSSFERRVTEILARLQAGDMTAGSVNENLTKDGRTITCEWHNTPMHSEDGHFIGLLSLVQDVTERRRAEQRLKTEHAIGTVIAHAPDLHEAAPKILQSICEETGWDVGALWVVDGNVLTCIDLWHVENLDVAEFRDLSRQSTFATGVDLVGRVWSARQPASVVDIATDSNSARVAVALRAGLRGGFGFPICFGNVVLGVAEFFSRTSQQPDAELLGTFSALGSQIGQFIERTRAERELRLFRALIDQTTDGIEVIDPATGRFLDVNERACLAHGYTREEFLSLSVPDVDPWVASRSWATLLEEGHLTGAGSTASVHRRKDGSTFPVEVNFNTIHLERDYMLAVVRDVTDRQRDEELLRESEAIKAAIVESALDCIVTMDSEGRIREFNPAAERTFGHARAAVVGKTVAEMLIPHALRERHSIGLAHYLATGEGPVLGRRLELTALRSDGTDFPVELAITRISTDGPPLFTAYLRDISERKQGEQALAERVRLASLVADVGLALTHGESLTDILQMCTQAVVRHLDAAFARIWTLDKDERFLELQASAGMYTHIDGPHGRVPVGQFKIGLIALERRFHLTNAVLGDPRVSDQEWARREGMVAFAGYPLLAGQRLVGVIAMFARHALSETTLQALDAIADQIALGIDRKGTEEALQSSQQRLQHVLTSSPAILFTLALVDDQVGEMNWVSDNLREILGYPPEAAFTPCWWRQNTHPEDREEAISQSHKKVFDSGFVTHEYRFRHQDGQYRWTREEIRLIRDPKGRPVEAVGSWSDITERKRLEDQFHQAQKMEAVGQLAAGVAHDFNNLLTIINGYSDLLLMNLPARDPSRALITEIHKAGERSAGLTRQLLAFSRQQVLAPRLLNLNDVVSDTEKMLHRLIGEDIYLSTRLESDLWGVRADPGQIEQVLLNLAVNAKDAMPQGGRLTIETANVELDETYTRSRADARAGAHVLLSVSDNGCGIPPEVKARIFEPFFTTKGLGKGTGLGLATVFGIVKQSSGHLTVHSEVGVGTTFKVYLPKTEQLPGEAKSKSGALTPPRGTETVLLVEDDEGVRGLTRRVLADCGYTVLEAANGDQALRIAAGHKERIDLLVTDVVMPGPGGRQVAEGVSALYAGLRVLFVSGYTDDAVIRHGVLREGVNFLQKPFSPVALAFKVRQVLDEPKQPVV